MKTLTLTISDRSRGIHQLLFCLLLIVASFTSFAGERKADPDDNTEFTINVPIHVNQIPDGVTFAVKCALSCTGSSPSPQDIYIKDPGGRYSNLAAESDWIELIPNAAGVINENISVKMTTHAIKSKEKVGFYTCYMKLKDNGGDVIDPGKQATAASESEAREYFSYRSHHSNLTSEEHIAGIEYLDTLFVVKGPIHHLFKPIDEFNNCELNPAADRR